jgi:hypothetical protein
MKTCIHTLGAMTIAASLCFGQEGQPPREHGKGKRPNPEEIFKRLDANSDGAVSLDEFKAGPRAKEHPEKAEEIFKKMDKDGNGSLSLEEFKSFRPPHPPRRPGKGDGGDPPQPPPLAE